MNPMMLMQLKDKAETFGREHPKMMPFFQTISQRALTEGSVLEIKATSVDGEEYVSNIKITANDMELISLLSGMKN